jgi:putative DNA primase/helicase
MSDDVLSLALKHLAGGVSVVPIAADGTKAPAVRWRPFMSRRPSEAEARRWWGGTPHGLAAVCGAVSGGLVLIDFDAEADAVFPDWLRLVRASLPRAASRVCAVRTPKPGWHVWLRCPEAGAVRNTKLARDGRAVLIETRGEGGYGLLPGCPPACHPSGGAYRRVSGPGVWALPALFGKELAVMLDAARAFDTAPTPVPRPVRPAAPGGGLRPGDDYDRRGDVLPVLLRHGWDVAAVRGDAVYLRRPGKDRGVSATLGHCRGRRDGAPLLKVFTSSTGFEPGAAYSPFQTYALLECGGDFRRAAEELRRQGFGEGRGA